MSRKSRYLLVLACFIIFLILSPVIVLYVRGVVFDFDKNQFVQTGVLAVRTEPKTVNIFLDGELKKEESGNIKFLKPKEYQIELKKQGYFDWSKRLSVASGQVTWAQGAFEKIYLLKNSSVTETIEQKVLDFYQNDTTLFFLTTTSFNIYPLSQPEEKQSFALNTAPNEFLENFQNKLFLLKNAGDTISLFDANNSTSTDLSGLFPQRADFKFDSDGGLLALENQNLYKVNYKNPGELSKTLLMSGIEAYATKDGDLYYVKPQNGKNSLFVSKSPYNQEFKLAEGLPEFNKAEIIVNFNKEIFLVADENLYQITNKPVKFASNVTSWNFGTDQSTLIFTALGELFSFNHKTNKEAQLITRGQKPLQNLVLQQNINCALASKENSILALELDTRDHQNSYKLYEGAAPVKFSLDKAGKRLILLEQNALKQLLVQ